MSKKHFIVINEQNYVFFEKRKKNGFGSVTSQINNILRASIWEAEKQEAERNRLLS